MTTPISDHFQQAYAKLIQTYQGKPRFAALLGTYIKQVQELEDATWTVIASRDVDTADDTRLEILGRLVGQPRRGATTEQFRLYVKARIKVNRSDGSPETLKSIARLLLGQGTTLTDGAVWERIVPKGPIDLAVTDADVVTELLREAHTAGVGFAFEFFAEPIPTLFHFVPGSLPVADGRGFSKLDGTLGGIFSRIRST